VARRRQRRQLRTGAIPDAVVLDSSALSGAATGLAWARAELSLAEELGVQVYVSSVTLTETLRGHRRDAPVHAVLAGTEQLPVTPELDRAAGELLGHTRREGTVDAIVAVTAPCASRPKYARSCQVRRLRSLVVPLPAAVPSLPCPTADAGAARVVAKARPSGLSGPKALGGKLAGQRYWRGARAAESGSLLMS